MIVPIYAPYFASGENHTVEYARDKTPVRCLYDRVGKTHRRHDMQE